MIECLACECGKLLLSHIQEYSVQIWPACHEYDMMEDLSEKSLSKLKRVHCQLQICIFTDDSTRCLQKLMVVTYGIIFKYPHCLWGLATFVDIAILRIFSMYYLDNGKNSWLISSLSDVAPLAKHSTISFPWMAIWARPKLNEVNFIFCCTFKIISISVSNCSIAIKLYKLSISIVKEL